jgi:hypothetical protein
MEKGKMRKCIKLPERGDTIKLVKATQSSYATVWRALTFQGDTPKMRKIRYVAIKDFLGQIVEF